MSMSPPPPPPPSSTPPPPPPGASPSSGAGSAVPGGRPLGSAGMRVLARFLDSLIVGIINLVLIGALLSGDTGSVGGLGADVSAGKLFVIALIGLAVGFVYDPVITKLKGGTPMKLAFGMNVVRADTGGPVEWSHAVIRWGVVAIWAIVPVLSFLVPLVLLIVSLVFIFTKPLRQAVWDLAAKTLVVSVR
ncbi:MAG: RDD family protein [Ilumatobacter sp.]|nr:RDD family protein [Ilumatobacter sp.]